MTHEQPKPTTLDMWAIIELMGHQRMAGKVTEVTIAGAGFLRVDVPETSRAAAFTRMVSPASVYAINPTTEEIARRAAEGLQPQPVREWELPKALPPAAATGRPCVACGRLTHAKSIETNGPRCTDCGGTPDGLPEEDDEDERF